MYSSPYREFHVLGLGVSVLLVLILGFTVSAFAGGFPGGHKDAEGPLFEISPQFTPPIISPQPGFDAIRRWNQIAINASGLDHTPVRPGENRVFGEQYGPCRASRAMAIVHIAIFDAVNAIFTGYRSYSGLQPAPHHTSMDAAVAQAGHDTLAYLFPSQTSSFDALLAEDLWRVHDEKAKVNGVKVGQQSASAIIALRTNDGSEYQEPRMGIEFIPSNLPGKWRQDPVSLKPIALGAYWYRVKPFVLKSASQYRAPVPPALKSAKYTAAYGEVKEIGGDGIITPTIRTAEQTLIGIYWAYDGTPSLCAPTRLYNQLTVNIADLMDTNGLELARLLALVNTAMADAAIACWDSKYYYQFWRPITAIRESDPGTGPTGLGDGNPLTIGDPAWTPFGGPASNLNGPNFTPPFPSYPSGHATFGGALFQVLRDFYKTDQIAFTFVSDELNGITVDNQGNVRPLVPRHFSSLSQAENENGQSRLYLGIHFHFDKDQGIAQGERVGHYVFGHAFHGEWSERGDFDFLDRERSEKGDL